jgi:glycosyltransferase involved in cell wall biosynthesis
VKTRRPLEIVPVGVNLRRISPLPQPEARRRLGLDQDGRYVLFPADPARPEKRHDRAVVVLKEFPAVQLLTLGGVDPAEVGLWYSAADLVMIPSDYEGFGLAVLEALACEAPVIATPTGIAPEALDGLANAHCIPFDLGEWRAAVRQVLSDAGSGVPGGPERAAHYATDPMARRLASLYQRIAAPRALAAGEQVAESGTAA